MDSLSISQARRIALAAQGFSAARPKGSSDRRQVRRVLHNHVRLFQIDSVNVLARAHEMPLWSRLGDHKRGMLDQLLNEGELFEYWAHEASLLPVSDWPLWQWKMQETEMRGHWSELRRLEASSPGFLDRTLQTVRERGPVAASDLKTTGRKTGPWWDWNDAKFALEWLFRFGKVTARRRANFEREYLVPEAAIPAEILRAPVPTAHDAHVALLDRAAQAVGVGTLSDLGDYFRLKSNATKPALQQLIEAQRVREVSVEGWTQPAYLHCEARLPRKITAATVLSPFDPTVWNRQRNERLFDFHYRIEIYTPAPKRVYGYYVLPFLLNEKIVGRLDVKADRKAGVLRVPGAFAEPTIGTNSEIEEVATAMALELRGLADWLNLTEITVARNGTIHHALRRSLSVPT